jgi:tRNA A-37 threonylcarbamoyl transferase component Bud32
MDNFGDFELLKILREIPFRRRVYLAKKGKSHFILKIFNLKKEYLKELKGGLILNESGVLTPKILSFGEKNTEFFIVFEYINNAISLEDYFKSNQGSIKKNIIKDLFQINMILHRLNIIQKDNHLKNYMISKNNIYVIDGGMIKKIKFLTSLRKLINLALLESKIDPALLKENINFYQSKILMTIKNFFKRYFIYKSIQRYLKKTLRTTSEFKRESNFSKLILRRHDFLFNFKEIDQLLNKSEVIKNGNTCTVFRHDNLIIKRYNLKSIWHFIALQFKKSRGLNSWQINNALNLLNISSPIPYFYYEKRFLFLRLNTYFAMSYQDSINIKDYESQLQTSQSRRNFSEKLFKFFNKLSFYRFIHGDLKHTNILVNNKNDDIFLIDFDKSFFSNYQYIYNFKIQKQLNRFYSNWEPGSKWAASLKKLEQKI